ncbi:MAG: hypothetical protein AAF264_03360, partial [Pseudomonadota bacterium]
MTELLELSPDPALEPVWLRIGRPHLGPEGLNESWLLRQAADLHLRQVARHVGCPMGALCDETGARAMASFVSARILGPVAAFQEDDLVHFRIVQDPL